MKKLENIRLAVSDRWQALGHINQVLIVFAGISVIGLSVTSFAFARQVLDARNIKCLAMNVYHEARGESTLGQYAVAAVTMNRVDSDKYPEDVCHVVYQKAWSKQQQRYIAAFSWTTDTAEDVPYESVAWKKAVRVAKEVYNDNAKSNVKGALFYHAEYVDPKWARNKLRITKIGRHIFYR